MYIILHNKIKKKLSINNPFLMSFPLQEALTQKSVLYRKILVVSSNNLDS